LHCNQILQEIWIIISNYCHKAFYFFSPKILKLIVDTPP
jgi:hypothetical protein